MQNNEEDKISYSEYAEYLGVEEDELSTMNWVDIMNSSAADYPSEDYPLILNMDYALCDLTMYVVDGDDDFETEGGDETQVVWALDENMDYIPDVQTFYGVDELEALVDEPVLQSGKHYIKTYICDYRPDGSPRFSENDVFKLVYADKQHKIPVLTQEEYATMLEYNGETCVARWFTDPTHKHQYDMDSYVTNHMSVFPSFGNKEFTLTVPSSLDIPSGPLRGELAGSYFDIDFDADDDFVGTVIFTLTNTDLNFAPLGYRVELYEDMDRSIPFTSASFTRDENKRIYIKKVYYHTEEDKAGTKNGELTYNVTVD